MTTERDWIGRMRRQEDLVTQRLSDEFRVTLGDLHCGHDAMPGLQWCLAPDIFAAADLGRDSHPRTGLVMPDLGLPRRMWAGGAINWSGGVRPGDRVTVETTLSDIAFKSGRSGNLGFVTLDMRYLVGGEVRVSERRDIVYRDDPAPDAPAPSPPAADPWDPVASRAALPDATLLFRYSAMTFNGHRIHYDLPYATEVEGYAGLVVHGPMQSTWMQHLATDILGAVPEEFSYRGVSPLVAGIPVAVEARAAEGGLDLRVRDTARNIVTMQAHARA